MREIGSFICFLGWASLFIGQLVLGLALLAIGFTLVLTGRR